MTAFHPNLSVENLESRLNLSSLPGLSIPVFIDVPIRAQERITLSDHQVVSLSDVLKDSQAPAASGETAAAGPAGGE